MSTIQEDKRFAAKVVRRLRQHYPEATCSLDFQNPLELLVATILSAQCTDQRVNQVTQKLFSQYRLATDFAEASQARLERDIQSTGFFRNKAKNLRACCRRLVEDHGGEVPDRMEALVALPGIGRKTANVILGTAYGIASGVVVDTHVGRLSRRLGLTGQKDPVKVERDLMDRLPKKEWVAFSHRMIRLGREFCTARKPNCEACPLESVCPRIGVDSV